MKIFRIFFLLFFVIVLFVAGFVVWFCTGSFTYQNSLHNEFVIDEPITVVCKRAMNIKLKPRSEGQIGAKVDMQQAAKNYSLGQPIEIEIDHPKLGTFKAQIKINLEADPNSLKIRGKTVSLEPREVKKFGKTVAEIENFTFVLKVAAKDGTGKDLGFMSLLSSSSKTSLELDADSEVRVGFRELGFLRSRIDRMAEKTRQQIDREIEIFLDENLRKPSEEELAQQRAREEKPQKGWNFWNLKKKQQDVPQQEQKSEPEVGTAVQDGEPIDVSALDEEI